MDQIKVSAPGKLMLFGEHAVVYDRPCIVTAVDSRVEVVVTPTSDKQFILNAPEVGLLNYQKPLNKLTDNTDDMPKGARFVEVSLKLFSDRYKLKHGFTINTNNGFSSKYGLGSSSAVTVCTIKALAELNQIPLSKKALFDLCYEAVLSVQKVGSGFDLAAAIYGGTLFFLTGGNIVRSLNNCSLNLVVAYSGTKADTPTMIRQVANQLEKDKNFITQKFNEIKEIVDDANRAFKDCDTNKLGNLMNQNQQILKSLGVVTPKLNRLIKASLKAGAMGAKISGSGGGDCLIVLVDDTTHHRVEKALVAEGGSLVPVEIDAEGVSTSKQS